MQYKASILGFCFMEKFIISGGKKLNGEVVVNSAKNAILPIIAGSLLTQRQVVLNKVPKIADVYKMLEIIKSLGGKVTTFGESVVIDNNNINNFKITYELTKDIRSSIFILGAMLSKYKKVSIAYPGGCDIGSRPIDLHLAGLIELGVKVTEENGFINCNGEDMKPSHIYLDFPSVGATENLIMASVLLCGETIISNCAKEPEIVDLANFLNALGAKVFGAGTSEIKITGVKVLHGAEYTPIGDRIVAGTLLIATALTGGKIELQNANPQHLLSLINKLRKSGCKIDFCSDKILLESRCRPTSCSFETATYPGFPTDLQPQMSVLLAVAKGMSIVTENLFETRFRHLSELAKMGAKVLIKDRVAIIEGVKFLHGAKVEAYDLRGGASLVLAGLVACGTTEVENIKYIDRGYVSLETTLSRLGADIKRIKL